MENCVSSLRENSIYNDGCYMYSLRSVLDKEYYYMITNIVKKKKLNVVLNHNLVPVSNFNVIKFNDPNQIINNTDLRSCDICKLSLPLNIKAEQNLHYTTKDYSHNKNISNDNEETEYINSFDICNGCYDTVDKTTIPTVFSVDSYFGIGYLTDWIVIFSFVKNTQKSYLSKDTLSYSSGHIICNLNPNSEHYKKFAIMHNSSRIYSNFKCYILNETSIDEIIKKYFLCSTQEYKDKIIKQYDKHVSWTDFTLNKETIKNLSPFQIMLMSHVPYCI